MGRGNRALYGRGLPFPSSTSHFLFFPFSRLPTKNTKGSLSNNDDDRYKNVTFKKSEFALPQTFLFQTVAIFFGVEFLGLHQSSGKEKGSFVV